MRQELLQAVRLACQGLETPRPTRSSQPAEPSALVEAGGTTMRCVDLQLDGQTAPLASKSAA